MKDLTQKDQLQQPFVTRKTFLQRAFAFRNVLLVLITSTAVLTIFAKTYPYFPFDLVITRYIQQLYLPGFDPLMRFISQVGGQVDATVVMLLAVLVLISFKKYRSSLMVVVSTLGAASVGEVVKRFIARPRPQAGLMIHQIGSYLKSDSFPSGHVLLAVGLYGFLLFLTFTQIKRGLKLRQVLLGLFSLPIILMGLSRIYLGAHWFSDVLGAYLIGYIWLLTAIQIYHLLGPKVRPE